ncbi:MAG: 5'/3'-nucleotidase SurE [Ktedonobacterales bacterium]|nr:5'/3'-nucleotidase SurE [Ktedonobacterales bacterium]
MTPLILVTNDDGIDSPGLHAAIRAAAPLGQVVAVAPRNQQTSMARALAGSPEGIVITQVTLPLPADVAYTAYSITATPALAAAYAILDILPRRPDLCISGINYGENIGATITASGTVGAALEASSFGVPALATSYQVPAHISHSREYVALDWTMATHFTQVVAEKMLRDGLPAGAVLLNLNVPVNATPQTPIQQTRQSRHLYYTWMKLPPTTDGAPPRLQKHIVHPTD